MQLSLLPALGTALWLTACASQQSSTEAALVGNWVTVRVAGYDALPEQCLQTGLELRPDGTFLDYSGAAELTGTYLVEPRGTGHLVTLTATADNGRPNCQGVLPAVLYADPVRRYQAQLDGRELRLHPPGQPGLWFIAKRKPATGE